MPSPGYQLLMWNLPAEELRDLIGHEINVREPDEWGDFALTVACHRLQRESVRMLLAAGADPNVQNADGDTPLLCAIDCVHHNPSEAIEIVKLLASAGAQLELRGYMDKTPFLKACSRGSLEMVKLLVQLKADARATVNDLGGEVNGLGFAEIFNAPKDMQQYLRGLHDA